MPTAPTFPYHSPMELHRLGEAAWLAYLADEPSAVRLTARIRKLAPAWLEDVVPAYATVGIYFDADRVAADAVAEWIGEAQTSPPSPLSEAERGDKTFTIPVCYELGLDLTAVAERLGLSVDAVIAPHMGTLYTVHAIGFVPGFPYLGYLPIALCGVPRLDSPRVRVEPGSVGLTGRQTGIYPLPRPGGWPLIGRTPLTLVDVAEGFFPLRVGDRVSFRRIDAGEYDQLQGERLTCPAAEATQ